MKTTARRSFLKAIGGSAVSLPFVTMLSDSVAQTAGEDLPLKFIGVYHPHGVSAEHWVRRDGETETEFSLLFENSSLAPFEDAATYGKSFKDKIVTIEGLDLLSSANGHDTAATILTGSRVATLPGNLSLDQYLAYDKGLGADTRLASVALAVGDDGATAGKCLSFGPGGAALPKIIDPVQAFDLLFSGFVVGDDPAAIAAAARQRMLGKSVIDFVHADVTRLHARVGAREKQKLDQHLTSLREVEKQFAEATAGVNCVVPPSPDAAAFPSYRMYNGGEPYFSVISDLFIDMLAQAMACDITRFGTLFLGDLSYEGNPLGLPADNHGGVAHTYNASIIGNDGHTQPGDPATWLPLAQINRYSYGQIARLMQRLDEFGVLESTLIYASSDMGNPALHSTRNVPTLLAGGAGGKIQMGRRIKLAPDCPPTNEWCQHGDADHAGVTNNHLLVSIMQAFGVEEDTFGTQPDPADTTGGLSELG